MASETLHIAAYDISDDRRRRQALYVLKGYSTGGQRSVFECFLDNSGVIRLVSSVRAILDPGADHFVLLELGNRPEILTLGIARPAVNPDFFYIG